jgi:hypothetical protein
MSKWTLSVNLSCLEELLTETSLLQILESFSTESLAKNSANLNFYQEPRFFVVQTSDYRSFGLKAQVRAKTLKSPVK